MQIERQSFYHSSPLIFGLASIPELQNNFQNHRVVYVNIQKKIQLHVKKYYKWISEFFTFGTEDNEEEVMN